MMKITILGDLVLGSAISCCTVRSPHTRTYHTAKTSKYLKTNMDGFWTTASMAPTDEQWMHSCLQSVDVSRRISLQVKTWKRKVTNMFKTHQSDLVRIQNHKFSDVKCSERSVKESELIEARQRFVSRELLHSFTCFTCYTSQGHKMPKVQASPVHWDIGCPSRQRMLQFGPSPAMQEATWATRDQLLKLTSFDLY